MRPLVFFTFLWSIPLFGQVVDVNMYTQMNGVLELPDGALTNFWGYGLNGGPLTFPAPLLEFNYGDTVNIRVQNPSPESHTIHLHGLDVDQANDGVPQTSFFIPFGGIGSYSFVADEPGTFLYHCHVTTTLHLTMGMYGMLVVKYPGDLLFQNGPHYEEEYHFLASDLEVRINDEPMQSLPFHLIYPDHFMVNGLAGSQIEMDTTMQIVAEAGQNIALRLGSMAYSKVKFIFPSGSNAMVHMSDGRPLPTSYLVNELEVYPGERFTVVMSPNSNMQGDIEVQYFNMRNKEFLASNFIPVKISENASNTNGTISPNPATESITLHVTEAQEEFSWYTYDGKLIARYRLPKGEHIIDLRGFSSGYYLITSDLGSTYKLVIGSIK